MARRLLLILWIICIADPLPISATEVYINESVKVDALNSFYSRFDTTKDKTQVIVDIDVFNGNDIDVYLVDETNFAKWINNQSLATYLTKSHTKVFTEDVYLGPKGRYYIILDNSYSMSTDKEVCVFVAFKTVTDLGDFIFIIPLAIAIVTLVSGIWLWSKRKNK
ncbi:MAG: hypothetical protein ACFFB3_09395 [Candidatus Hodarchaeota archaeon]